MLIKKTEPSCVNSNNVHQIEFPLKGWKVTKYNSFQILMTVSQLHAFEYVFRMLN